MRMTRAILRLAALLVLAFGLFGLTGAGLAVLALVLLAIALFSRPELPRIWLMRVLRLKWFFAAIFILYLLGGIGSDAGVALQEAAYRVGILVVLVGAVAICLDRLPPYELAEGLRRLLQPLSMMGVPVARFAHRLAVTLDAVNHMDLRVRALRRQQGLDALAQICLEAEQFESTHSPEPVVVEGRAVEWCLFLGSLAVILGLHQF